MLIAHCADLHITDSPGESRATLTEQVELLKWIADDAVEHGAELIVCAGDVYDGASTPVERQAAIEVFAYWAAHAPVVAVSGNHDRPKDLWPLAHLRTIHPVHIAERPMVTGAAGIMVACLPWPLKAHLVAAMGSVSALEVDAAMTDALRSVLAGLRAELDEHSGPKILLAHVEPGGAALDSGQPVAARCVVRISEGDLLDVGVDYEALGHIHMHQIIGDGRLCFSGATRQCTFGEDPVKGYCLVEVERGKAPAIEHRRGPGRELVTITGEWVGSVLDNDGDGIQEINHIVIDGHDPGAEPSDCADAAVRLTYHVPEDARAAASDDADRYKERMLELGAHSVKLDPRVVAVSRVRSEEIRTARTTEERLEAWWISRDQRPKRAMELIAKTNALTAEVSV